MPEPLNYESIQNRLKMENRLPGLQKLEPAFFLDLERYQRGLQEDYLREQERSPGSPKATLLHDELQNTRHLAEALYEARERKVVQRALAAVRGGALDTAHMTKDELDFAARLVGVLREQRRATLRPGASGPRTQAAAPAETERPPDSVPPSAASADPALAPKEPASGIGEAPAPSARDARVLVRILDAVPPFQASDLRTYRLSKGDVVTLPRDAARALLLHKKAVEVQAVG